MSQSQIHSHTDDDYARFIAVGSYLTIIGWLISLFVYAEHKSCLARFHLRQALGLIVTGAILSFIPFIGWLLTLVVALFWFMGVAYAYKGECYPVPVLGDFFQEHLDFIT